jgi:hypothetical protein
LSLLGEALQQEELTIFTSTDHEEDLWSGWFNTEALPQLCAARLRWLGAPLV